MIPPRRRPHPHAPRTLGVVAALLGLSWVATGCGGEDAPERLPLSATEHNDADIAYATDMIQHHAQALVLVDLTLGRSLTPAVALLAEQIREVEAPQIELMSDWLQEWDEPVPPTMRDHVNAAHDAEELAASMEGTDTSLPGIVPATALASLDESGSDADFSTGWLELMIEHHDGAVELARLQQEQGRFEAAVELSREVASAQGAEIATMTDLLGAPGR